MANDLSFTLDTKMLDAIVRDSDKKGEQILRKLAFEVEGKAKQLAPYDTTALRNSIYTQTDKVDGYDAAVSEVASKRPDVKVHRNPKPGKGEAIVGPCVEYGAAVEFGHRTKPFKKSYGAQNFVPAHPYMTPAVEAIRNKFESGETYRELCDPKSEDWLI